MAQARTVVTELNLQIRKTPICCQTIYWSRVLPAKWEAWPSGRKWTTSIRHRTTWCRAARFMPVRGRSAIRRNWASRFSRWPGGDRRAQHDLQYAFVNSSEKLDAGLSQSEIVRALTTWSKYVQVNWTESSDTNANRTVAIMFASGDHGDGYPFSGSGVVAHTFYPYPVNAEPLAGNMHFNEDENWHIGADVDLFSVALHEAGHALGLGHSDVPGAVMYPYYHEATGLSAEDIAAIQTLYTPRGDTGAKPAALELILNDPGATTTR